MRRVKKYKILKEEISEQVAAGRYNPALVLDYQNRRYELENGYSDKLTIFGSKDTVYVLGINGRLGYVSLTVFDKEEQGVIDSIFLQSEEDIRGTLGRNFGKMRELTIIKRLTEFLS
ncbi:MAG: hypothetical protein NTX36_15480 [Proteobacteria bacterium]|nr:hypothetical protein [Pseudomonadota bacterium]